jgi:hypothetical protein
MSDSKEKQYYESLVQYYRSKCIQMEYEFVIYKIKTEQSINDLNMSIQNIKLKHLEDVEKLKNRIVEEQRSKK